MLIFRLIVLAASVIAQPSWGQAQQQPPALDHAAPSTPSTDRNENAPQGPALAEEPHGSGSVYDELEAVRREQGAKEQVGDSDHPR